MAVSSQIAPLDQNVQFGLPLTGWNTQAANLPAQRTSEILLTEVPYRWQPIRCSSLYLPEDPAAGRLASLHVATRHLY